MTSFNNGIDVMNLLCDLDLRGFLIILRKLIVKFLNFFWKRRGMGVGCLFMCKHCGSINSYFCKGV